MFERCDRHTRTVIDTAVAESKRLGHGWVGTEHMLIALTIHRDLLPEPVARLLPTPGQTRQAVHAITDPAPESPDSQLLASLGIDIERVRATVRETFGSAAIDRLAQRRVHQPWRPWRRPRRACVSLLAGHQRLAPRAKQALEHAAQHQQLVSPATLLWGITAVADALASRLLDDLGTSPTDLRHAIEQAAP